MLMYFILYLALKILVKDSFQLKTTIITGWTCRKYNLDNLTIIMMETLQDYSVVNNRGYS
jgi:hypothetical protein